MKEDIMNRGTKSKMIADFSSGYSEYKSIEQHL